MNPFSTPEVATASDEQRHFRAFLVDEETRRVVDHVIADLLIPNATIQRGGIRAAIEALGAQRSPKLLLVDISEAQLPISAIDELAEVCEPGIAVIALGERNDVGIFRDLIQHGISDYLVKPISASLLQRSLLTAMGASSPVKQNDRLGRLIVVAGARGGVGSTMLATGIAWSIANDRRRRVALVDLDLQHGSAALALDLEPSHGLREALEHPNRIDDLFVDRTMIRHSETLHVLSSEEPLSEPMALDLGAVAMLLKELRNRFHYVVVDLPRLTSALTLQTLQAATNLVLVTDLSLAGMRDTLRFTTLMPSLNAACQVTLTANKVGEHRQGEMGRAEFEAGIGRKLDVMIPFDARVVAAALNVGRPIGTSRNRVADAVAKVVTCTIGSTAAKGPRKLRLLPAWVR